jgi:hypothetical protein
MASVPVPDKYIFEIRGLEHKLLTDTRVVDSLVDKMTSATTLSDRDKVLYSWHNDLTIRRIESSTSTNSGRIQMNVYLTPVCGLESTPHKISLSKRGTSLGGKVSYSDKKKDLILEMNRTGLISALPGIDETSNKIQKIISKTGEDYHTGTGASVATIVEYNRIRNEFIDCLRNDLIREIYEETTDEEVDKKDIFKYNVIFNGIEVNKDNLEFSVVEGGRKDDIRYINVFFSFVDININEIKRLALYCRINKNLADGKSLLDFNGKSVRSHYKNLMHYSSDKIIYPMITARHKSYDTILTNFIREISKDQDRGRFPIYEYTKFDLYMLSTDYNDALVASGRRPIFSATVYTKASSTGPAVAGAGAGAASGYVPRPSIAPRPSVAPIPSTAPALLGVSVLTNKITGDISYANGPLESTTWLRGKPKEYIEKVKQIDMELKNERSESDKIRATESRRVREEARTTGASRSTVSTVSSRYGMRGGGENNDSVPEYYKKYLKYKEKYMRLKNE